MKKMLITSIIIVISAAIGVSQNKGAIIKFENTVHDYGTITQNADGKCEFKFKNEGDEPLVLSSARSSCGCTVPQWPKEPILPGQSGVILVSYDTKRIGQINKQITVISNANEPSVILSIKGNVIPAPQEVLPEKPTDDGFTPKAN